MLQVESEVVVQRYGALWAGWGFLAILRGKATAAALALFRGLSRARVASLVCSAVLSSVKVSSGRHALVTGMVVIRSLLFSQPLLTGCILQIS